MEGLQDIWGWQPALYLFLGGMGAGAFIAAMVVYFREGDKARSTVFASLVAAVVCLAVGLLLLLSELITPLRGMMMWQSFSNFGSWMTFGAWIVFAALVVFALEAIVVWEKTAGALAKRIKGFDGYAPKLARALGVVSCVLGFCVAVYTGILLMSAPGVPLWNTLLLPCLFTVSALDTGVALVEVTRWPTVRRPRFPRRRTAFWSTRSWRWWCWSWQCWPSFWSPWRARRFRSPTRPPLPPNRPHSSSEAIWLCRSGRWSSWLDWSAPLRRRLSPWWASPTRPRAPRSGVLWAP